MDSERLRLFRGNHATATHKPTVCSAQARAAFAQYLALPLARVASAASTGNNGFPQCTLSAEIAGGGHVSLSASDYTGPKPYFILERTNVEQVQIFGPERLVPAPVPVNNPGFEADWFRSLTRSHGPLLSRAPI